MPKAIRIHKHGGPEVLQWEEIEVASPGSNEILLVQNAAGLNFIDCYQRSGLYPMQLPCTLGAEGVGTIRELGPQVKTLSVGQRVAYAGGQTGSYSEMRVISADSVVPLPDNIDDITAAGMMLKGMTVHMLLFKSYKVCSGDKILVHAAAGGVGTILCQWANYLGATVIGTVGSDEKAEKAKSNGCHHTINYKTENFAEKVREITDGIGVPVVYDSVGKNTFEGSLDCLKHFGSLITYGNASGAIPGVEPLKLMQKGSISMSRPTLLHYAADPIQKEYAANELFKVVAENHVKIDIGQTFPLKEARKAHINLENRLTTGSTVFLINH